MRTGLVALALVAAVCTGTTSDAEPATVTSGPRETPAPTTVPPTETSAAPTMTTDAVTASTSPAPPAEATTCWTAAAASGTPAITFVDRTAEYGLVGPLTGMHAHAAAWADLDAGGGADLVAGTFADRRVDAYAVRGATQPSPDSLLIGGASFTREMSFPAVFGRTSGAVAADLDNDGDNDIVLARNMRPKEQGDAPTQIYRNDDGAFTLVDIDFGRFFSGRSIGVLDYNHDDLLDLFVVEDRFGSGDSSILLENVGGLAFRDVTVATGIGEGVHGLGIATSDLNGDGYTDFFVGGSNRMFLGGPSGFTELISDVFTWEAYGNEDDVAGAAIADVNRDGLPDLVVGHHYNSTVDRGELVPIRLYLNGGVDSSGQPRFEDVTERSGLPGLPTKAPHVEFADLDNDGWPDILSTASAGDGTGPAVFRHLGLDKDGVPLFATPEGLGSPQYWVTGPTADVDRDGRLDLLLVEWEPTLPSLLMMNDSASGHWLEISVGPEAGVAAIGAVVRVWEAGGMGDVDRLIGLREVVASQGYAAGNLQVAHFGLGDEVEVDVEVVLPDGRVFQLPAIAADQHVRLPGGCQP